MTKVIMNIKEDGEIFFDCINHADDYDVCTGITMLCNVLVKAAERSGFPPVAYNDGHVRICIEGAEYPLVEVFRAVLDVFVELQLDFPDNVRVY